MLTRNVGWKKGIFVMALLAQATAWADGEGSSYDFGQTENRAKLEARSAIPADAKLLFQTSRFKHYDSETQESLVNAVLEDLKNQEATLKIDVEYKCQAILHRWSYESNTYCYRGTGWGPGGCFNPFNQVFGTSEFKSSVSVTVNTYCQERSYDQKVILSLLRRCEQNPTAECLSESVRSSFRQLQPTLRYDIGKP